MATSIERVRSSIGAELKSIQNAGKLSDAEAKQVAWMIQTQCSKNDKLLEAALKNPDSLLQAARQALLIGLVPDGTMAYLVPYKGVVTFVPGYMGLVQLMYRSSLVQSVDAHNVFQAEFDDPQFQLDYSASPVVRGHKPRSPSQRGEYVGTYAIVRLVNGGTPSVWMWKEEVEAIRDRSPASSSNYSPWAHKDDYFEMAKKTAIKRLRKLCPQSPELIQAAMQDDAYEAGMIDVEATSVTVDSGVASRVRSKAKTMAQVVAPVPESDTFIPGDYEPEPAGSAVAVIATSTLCSPDTAKKIVARLKEMDGEQRKAVCVNWNFDPLRLEVGVMKLTEREANDLWLEIAQ